MTTNANVDAGRIVEVLNRLEVAYVIIGGYAAELHEVAGLPPTRDVDVCPATDSENLARLFAALTELHALIRTDAVDGGLPFAHDAESLARASMWNLVRGAVELDISFDPSGGGYGHLALHRTGCAMDVPSAPMRRQNVQVGVASPPLLRPVAIEEVELECETTEQPAVAGQ